MKQKYMVVVTLWLAILFSVTYVYSTQLEFFPDFVQTATRFDSVSIESKTTRYFSLRKTTQMNRYNTEFSCFALRNTGNIMVRVSGFNALTFGTNIFVADSSSTKQMANNTVCSLYKNSAITGGSFISFDPSSVIQINPNFGTSFSGGTLVFEVYSTFDNVSSSGGSSVSINIPKELYSVMIGPGETLLITAMSGLGLPTAGILVELTRLLITIEWEEIIN